MREVRLDEETYKKAEIEANKRGFADVDSYLTWLIQDDESGFDAKAFFNPERLADLDRRAERAMAGRTYTPAEVREYFKDLEAKWRSDRAG